MTILYHDENVSAYQARNEWFYPPGCLPKYEDNVLRVVRFYHNADYDTEHRPYPPDLDLSLTSRPEVYCREGVSPVRDVVMHTTEMCPHSGTHGSVHKIAYLTGGSTLYSSPILDDLSSQKLWAAKLRDKLSVQKVNLGSSLAEYRESVRMFVKTAHALHNAYGVLRGRLPRKKLRACSVPAAVLQYNFGVAPLVGDLYSSVEALRFRLNKPLRRKLSVGVKVGRDKPFTYGPHSYFDVECVYKERAKISYELNPSQYLSQDFDFGNPVEWAWELIPFSFVVDWAIPIGSWLGRLDALQGVGDINGTVTIRRDNRWKYVSVDSKTYESPGTYHGVTYKRSVITTIPMPPFPKWSPSLSWRRAINGVSLLLGISKSCRSGA